MRQDWRQQKSGVRKFLTWIEETQLQNSWDLSELLQLEQDFIKDQEKEED